MLILKSIVGAILECCFIRLTIGPDDWLGAVGAVFAKFITCYQIQLYQIE